MASEEEYIEYLMILRQLEEFEIISMLLMLNNKVFLIKDNEFESWLRNHDTPPSESFMKNTLLGNEFLKFKKKINIRSVSAIHYIERTKLKLKTLFKERMQITLLYYFHITDLSDKSNFGELGLNSQNQKRLISIK